MLKILVILAGLIVSIGGNTSKEQNRSRLTQYDSYYHPLPTAAFFPRDEATAPDTQTADNEPPHWYIVPEWWICILGVPTLAFVGIQSYLMRVHAGHFKELAEKTADAAIATQTSAAATRQQVAQMVVQTNTAQLAAGTALEQLRVMQIQADEITRQVNLMETQAKNARDRERARLSISGVTQPEFQPSGSFLAGENMVPVLIAIFVTLDGSTNAYNVTASGAMRVILNGSAILTGSLSIFPLPC